MAKEKDMTYYMTILSIFQKNRKNRKKGRKCKFLSSVPFSPKQTTLISENIQTPRKVDLKNSITYKING